MIDPRENNLFDPRQEVKDNEESAQKFIDAAAEVRNERLAAELEGYQFKLDGVFVTISQEGKKSLTVSANQIIKKGKKWVDTMFETAQNQDAIKDANRAMVDAAIKNADSREADME